MPCSKPRALARTTRPLVALAVAAAKMTPLSASMIQYGSLALPTVTLATPRHIGTVAPTLLGTNSPEVGPHTVIVTVAMLESSCPSEARNVNWSVPKKPALRTYI